MFKSKLVNILARIICPYGSIRKVLRGPLAGAKFYVAPSMGLTYMLGFDAMSWNFLKDKFGVGSVILDIGANRGQMALFFSKFAGGQ